MQVSFGEFVLDLDSRELRRGAEPVRLSPKAFQLLELLVTNRPRALSKADLQDRLWPNTFVVEKNLANLVSEIRQVLGDSPSGSSFIRTVPRYGYAFHHSGPEAPQSSFLHRLPVRRRATLALGGLAVLVIAGLLAASLPVKRWRAPADQIRLGVLPLQNLTGDPDQDYLCDGLTEELIAQLGGADPDRLVVIARTSAMHYRNTTKRAHEIGRELSVGHLLETSLRREGDRVRVTAQLVVTETEGHVWVEQYERDVVDVLALQREVAGLVMRRTTDSLGVNARSPDAVRHSSNALANELYLRGRHHWLKNTWDGLRRAQDHFQRAIDLDPAYAHAHSGLSETYALLGSFGLMPIAESHSQARDAALKALALDDGLADAHRSLATVLGDYDWDWAEAERHYRRAIDLAPNDVTSLRSYSFYLASTGRPGEALPIAERAASLDPVSPNVQMNLGLVLYIARQADKAVRQLEQTLELDENFGFAHVVLGLTYASQRLADRALVELQKARAWAGSRPDVVAVHGYTLGRAGRRSEALETLDELRRLASPRDPPPFQVAVVYVGLEDWDRAFEWLEKAIDGRAWEVPLVKADPVFDGLRRHQRFPKLLARLRLPE
jgi:TolB-like protein/DNA-binding winged helix-turn-helix (wHTH) protein/tetratricopeptide (TPR) repeat protein